MPVIDATSAVLFAAGSVVIALVLCTALRRHRFSDPGLRWRVCSNCALLLAASGVLLSDLLGFQAASLLVIGGAFAGICAAWFAVLHSESKSIPLKTVVILGTLALCLQGWLAVSFESVNMLMLSSSAVNSVLLGWIIWRVWVQVRPYSRRMASLMSMPFALLFVGYALRLPLVLIWPDGAAPLLATMMIIVSMAWASVILELAMISLREVQVQRELRIALEKAEMATHARTRFLLGISHDLRTPLNAILGLSELMRNEVLGCLPKPYAEQVQHIYTNGMSLNELVGDLLLHASEHGDAAEGSESANVDRAVRDKFDEAPRKAVVHGKPRDVA